MASRQIMLFMFDTVRLDYSLEGHKYCCVFARLQLPNEHILTDSLCVLGRDSGLTDAATSCLMHPVTDN